MGLEIEVRWTLGHEGITENERADAKAKKVAGRESRMRELLLIPLRRKVPVGKSAAYQGYTKKVQKWSAKWFASSPRYHHMRQIDPSMLSSKFRKDTCDLTCRQMSLLIQLRSGHVPLNKHLHRIGKVDSPKSLACQVSNKTVHHFLVTCPKYAPQWRLLEGNLQQPGRSEPC